VCVCLLICLFSSCASQWSVETVHHTPSLSTDYALQQCGLNRVQEMSWKIEKIKGQKFLCDAKFNFKFL